VEKELNLGDHFERIRVERDSALCELLNRDVGNLCGWLNFGNKSCVYVLAYPNLLFVFPQVHSCSKFDLT
jgi:hypothetical protein